jgi:hypothetical protein
MGEKLSKEYMAEIAHKMVTPLTGEDVSRWLTAHGMSPTVIKYEELHQFKELPVSVGSPLILLYETSYNKGHWVAVLATPEGIEHFDSYGVLPDKELGYICCEFRRMSGQVSPYLVRLLINYNHKFRVPINYNQFKFQSKDPNIATCGRWCVLRCLMCKMPIKKFKKKIDNMARDHGLSYDAVVCEII